MKSRIWLAAILVSLLQTGAIAAIIVNRAGLLTHGREIILLVEPVDPRDLLRGDFVRLSYGVSRIPTSLMALSDRKGGSQSVFVTLERQGQPEDGKWAPVAVSPQRPDTLETENKIILRGTMDHAWAQLDPAFFVPNVRVTYGIESYFVPENTGRELEEAARVGAVKVIVSVNRDGAPAIKGLIANGTRYEESLF
jgi:uncharacterized membrane-anchored protein